MTLLYADLPAQPESPTERNRVEFVLGAVASVGAALVGARVVGDIFGSSGPGRRDRNGFATSATIGEFTGVERIVESDPTVVALGQVPVVEYAPVSDDANSRSELDSVPSPAPLPGTGTPPKTVPAAPPPADPAPVPTAPISSTNPSTSAPSTTVPSTTVPSTTVPPTTTVSPTTTSPPVGVEPPADVRTFAMAAGFNLTSQMVTTIDAVGYEGWVDMQVDPSTTPDPVVDAVVADFDLLDTDPATLHAAGLGPAALSQARWASFARAMVGERQAEEAMVGLWREFFAVRAPAADLVGLEQVIRHHVFDGYSALLNGVLGSSAYQAAFALSPDASAAQILDSNLARTVLERFAYGDPTTFDEADIEAAAVALASDRSAFLAGLAAGPLVANFVAGLITRHLLGDAAPPEAHAAARSAFVASDGSLRAVTRQLLIDGLAHADPTRVRTGAGWLTACLRSLRADITIGGEWNPDEPNSLPGALRLLGAEPGTGALRADEQWLAPTMVSRRWQIARSVTGRSFTDTVIPASEVIEPHTAAELIDQVAESCAASLNADERLALLHYLSLDLEDPAPILDQSAMADIQGLVLSFPSFQQRDGGRS